MIQKPITFNSDLAHLPTALLPLTLKPRWVVWKWVYRPAKNGAEGKWTKPPYQPLNPHRFAKANDPATWGSHADAVNAWLAKEADGIGYMLLDDDLAPADLDHCRDPETGVIDAWGQAIVDKARAAKAYVEVTVSGAGLRGIGRSSGPTIGRQWKVEGREGAGIEVYRNCARYITVSGCEIGHCDELPETDLIDQIVTEYDGYSQPKKNDTRSNGNGFDFNKARSQHGDIDDLIVNGAPDGERHQTFQRVVFHLAAQGLGLDDIEARLREFPGGIVRDLYTRGKYRDVILPLTVLRRLGIWRCSMALREARWQLSRLPRFQ